MLRVHFDDPTEYYYTVMLAGANSERQVPEDRLRPHCEPDTQSAGGGTPIWDMDSVQGLRKSLQMFADAGVAYATVGPSERL